MMIKAHIFSAVTIPLPSALTLDELALSCIPKVTEGRIKTKRKQIGSFDLWDWDPYGDDGDPLLISKLMISIFTMVTRALKITVPSDLLALFLRPRSLSIPMPTKRVRIFGPGCSSSPTMKSALFHWPAKLTRCFPRSYTNDIHSSPTPTYRLETITWIDVKLSFDHPITPKAVLPLNFNLQRSCIATNGAQVLTLRNPTMMISTPLLIIPSSPVYSSFIEYILKNYRGASPSFSNYVMINCKNWSVVVTLRDEPFSLPIQLQPQFPRDLLEMVTVTTAGLAASQTVTNDIPQAHLQTKANGRQPLCGPRLLASLVIVYVQWAYFSKHFSVEGHEEGDE
ncbi:hypothetical protein BDK51DRAFT_25633 [Blyttiomyces helicus]|uniref:Uncharacterized protein n=1 Tax=Blyttiomyces helicus TaxID=388810 RepID=A0A4P9WCM4_9FUNG|nr:hypothetical protein BDK51DRAFT_25633 [Blyttiomyces helicus]|eukprot:RKO90264.1 hypothetical protein BDK51DRAFT_25633 [Blyttiomyces helicus]